MKKLPIFLVILFCGCSPKDDALTKAWFSNLDGRELTAIYAGIGTIHDDKSESIEEAIEVYLNYQKDITQLAPPIEGMKTASLMSFIFRANRSGKDGFVVLSKNKTKDRLAWTGRFIASDYFKK